MSQFWCPMSTAPEDFACLWWVVPKSADEAYTDTSGNPIVSHGEPRIVMGKKPCWSSLEKATHWHPLPTLPKPDNSSAESQ
jgi:hypothetical protein